MNFSKYLVSLLIFATFISCEKKEEDEVEPVLAKPTFVLNDAFDITTNSAELTGIVTGESIQEVGFVYGKISNLSESSARRFLGTQPGEIAATLNSLEDNTTYFYAAYAVDDSSNFYKSEVKSFKTEEATVLKLGDVYEGGIIYYLDFSKEHGRLASPLNITTGTNWQTAFDDCYAYELNGNADWRLPDLDELEELYAVKSIVGGFADIAYWSSSVEGSNPSLAYGVYFGGGANAGKSFVYDKTGTYQYSRAIRDF